MGPVRVLSGQGPAPPRFQVGATIGYFIVGGQDLGAIEDALGLEAYWGYRPFPKVSLNLGGHFSKHGDLSIWTWDVFGVYVEPRLHLGGSLPLGRPYLGFRGWWLHRNQDTDSGSLSSSGFAGSGILGTLLNLSKSVKLEIAASATRVSFAGFFYEGLQSRPPLAPGESPPEVVVPRDVGSAFAIHVGVLFPLPF
jgi:hypothetical protein